jgi:hypothetical protein
LNRNRLIAAIITAVVFLLVLIVGGIRLWRSTRVAPHIGHKVFVARLGYCGAADTGPCIISFSQDGEANMQVDILIPSSNFPTFYLTISRVGEEYRYECEKVEDFPTNVYCTGQEIFPGELLQFTLVSKEDERVLAEGQFAIIGLLLSTPVAEAFESTPPPEAPTEFPTPIFLEVLTPVPTATNSSYPNPSYPNPSYGNP